MQPLRATFLSLLVGYLLTHFVSQTDLSQTRRRQRIALALKYGTLQYVLTLGVLLFFTRPLLSSARPYLILLSLVAVHQVLTKRLFPGTQDVSETAWALVVLQAVLVGTVAAAALLISGASWKDCAVAFHLAEGIREKLLAGAVVYAATVFGGGHLIRYLTKPLMPRCPLDASETVEELRNAGLYIGWLERFVILTALLLQSPTTVGLILTGKSVARFPELKEARFAEYFLIGTLLSVTVALVGGLVLLYLIHGTVSLQ